MKNSLKKGIVAVALASTMVIPMVVSASADELTGGAVRYSYNLYSGWADHEHHSISVRIQSSNGSASQSGWGHAETRAIYGEHGRVYYNDGTTSTSKGY